MAPMRLVRFVLAVHGFRVVQCLQTRQQNVVITKNEIAANTDVACIGKMCGRRGPISLYQGAENTQNIQATVTEYALLGRHPFCTPDQSSPSRLLLLPLVAPHHGSDALASVLMSSNEVATLCSANTWKCDGSEIIAKNDSAAGDGWLDRFSPHWDLKKHVLLAPHADIITEMLTFEEELQDGPPKAMKQAGIKRVFLLNLMLWRPICLGELSPGMYDKTEEYAREELKILEEQVAMHKQFMAAKQPVLVMNLADLLWNPFWSQSRMEKMIPCIGKLDVNAVPKLHHHHYPQNAFKFDTSVKQFGEANPPNQCGYTVAKRSCGKSHNAFYQLPHEEQMRARAATKYLDKWSQ